MSYSGFERQTAIALASKLNSHLAKLSESELGIGEGSFEYDYSFLEEYELGKVLSLASYELGFTYQFAYSRKNQVNCSMKNVRSLHQKIQIIQICGFFFFSVMVLSSYYFLPCS